MNADENGYHDKSAAIAENKQRAAGFEDLMTRAALAVREEKTYPSSISPVSAN